MAKANKAAPKGAAPKRTAPKNAATERASPTRTTPKSGAPKTTRPAKKAASPSAPRAKRATPSASAPEVAAPAKKAPAPKRDPALGPVVKTRVVIPIAYYEPNKDAIKAPFKANGMKWNYLGEGKGLYKRERDIHCFTQFMDDGVHYSVWGDDKKGAQAVLDAWRALAGEATWAAWLAAGEGARVAEAEVKESEAVKLWKLQEPQRRTGEPDLFYHKRRDEWMAKKPSS